MIHKPSRTIQNPLFGDKVTFMETAAETNGAHTLVHVELAAGAIGPPIHYHTTYDETFTVIEGVLGIQLGEQTLHLEKGDRCTAPIGTPHRFFNPSKTEKVIFAAMVSPGSADFETMLQVGYGLANDGLTNSKGIPKSMEYLALIVQWGDTNLPGVFNVVSPLLKLIAQRARRKGVDKMLMARYCRLSMQPEPKSIVRNVEEGMMYAF